MVSYSKKFLVSLVWVAFMASLPAFAQSTAPKRSDYESTPFWVAAPTIPHVMLIMSKEYKMFQPAYAGLNIDIDGNGRIDTGFNAGVIYTGYFDSYSCYAYSKNSTTTGGSTAGSSAKTLPVDTGSRFRWASRSDTTAKQRGRPSIIPRLVDEPKSKVGLCGSHKGGTFSGNWLNYMTSSRMDVLRKILYGGARVVDPSNTKENLTILDNSLVPPDSSVWGADVFADNIWYKTPYNAYYHLSDFTPYGPPKDDHATYFARVRNLNPSSDHSAGGRDKANPREVLRVATNVYVNPPIFGEPNKNDLAVDRRYWDWFLDVVTPVPNDSILGPAFFYGDSNGYFLYNLNYQETSKRKWASKPFFENYNTSVEVCDTRKTAQPGESSTYGCLKYPNGNYKPIGLLQSFGADNKMFFGLITGGYGETDYPDSIPLALNGGILRHHVDSISKSINGNTGQLTKHGIPWVLSQLNIAGKNHIKFGNTPYVNTYSWGNPLGEMLYEAVRYMGIKHKTNLSGIMPMKEFSRFEQGTTAGDDNFGTRVDRGYTDYNDPPFTSKYNPFHDSGRIDYLDIMNSLYLWNKKPTGGRGFMPFPLVNGKSLLLTPCSKPIILMFSGSDSSYDSTLFGGDSSIVEGRPLLAGITGAGKAKFPSDSAVFDYKAYLKLIADNEKFYSQYLIPKVYESNRGSMVACTKQGISAKNFADIEGLCPFSPATKGTYSLAAMAYYARVHNFNNDSEDKAPVEKYMSFYGVNLGAAFPEITFVLPGGTDRVITILPVATSAKENGLLNFNNYYIDDLQLTDGNVPFHMEVVVNFSDVSRGGGFATNARVKYTIDLFSARSHINTNKKNAYDYLMDIHSDRGKSIPGDVAYDDLKFSGLNPKVIRPNDQNKYKSYYFFRQLRGPDGSGGNTAIAKDDVYGISIFTKVINDDTAHKMGFGYTITGLGSGYSGTYIDVGLRTDLNNNSGCRFNSTVGTRMQRCPPPPSPFNTSYNCEKPSTGLSVAGCAMNNGDRLGDHNFQAVRFFKTLGDAYASWSDVAKQLPNPMWLAAKYGGFDDMNNNGVPDDGEWERTSGPNTGAPRNYYQVTNIADLVDQLRLAFEDISKVSQTGTANASSVNAILGSGISIETRYHTIYDGGGKEKAKWVGSIFALFRDKWDNLREDTNENGVLDLATKCPPGTPGAKCGDRVVFFKATESEVGVSLPTIELYNDPMGDGTLVLDEILGTNVEHIKHVWNYPRFLSGFSDDKMINSRAFGTKAGENVRRIYSYYEPHEADGTVAWPTKGVQLGDNHLFNSTKATNPRLHKLMRQTTKEGTEKLINYTLGKEYPEFKSRSVVTPWPKPAGSPPGALNVWRVGDVMNSRPVIVGTPSNAYDVLYGDVSYAKFKQENARRRQVAYFGGNDGILRAVNLGFYSATADKGSSGYTTYNKEDPSDVQHELGAELWGYIPTSVLPHLEWVADRDYQHAYYVDLVPQIFDITIGGKWKTILVGGLRLGGRSISLEPTAGSPGESPAEPEYSYSEFFALDVTDPEVEPKLLWRFSVPQLGMSSALPTVVRSTMSNDTAWKDTWYVILGSGPTDLSEEGFPPPPSAVGGENPSYQGSSTHPARVFVLDAENGGIRKTIILGDVIPGFSFITSIVSPMAEKVTKKDGKLAWSNSMAYLSYTIIEPPGAGEEDDEARRWGGGVARLRMINENNSPLDIHAWRLEPFFDTKRAITGSVNAAKDKLGNIWVIFGSGRVWWKGDLTPCGTGTIAPNCAKGSTQYIYGIKEPRDTDGKLTFAKVLNDDKILDVSGIKVYDALAKNLVFDDPGHPFAGTPSYLALSASLASNEYGGYKRALNSLATLDLDKSPEIFEIITTQPQLIPLSRSRSLVGVSSYLTSSDICNPQGEGFLLAYDTYTGLPAPYLGGSTATGFEDGTPIGEGTDAIKQATGVVRSGQGMPTEASFSVSSSGIKGSNKGGSGGLASFTLDDSNTLSNQVLSWREVLDIGLKELVHEDWVHGLNVDE